MTLKQIETQVHNRGQQRREGMPPNIGRYKKTVWSIALVQLALIACYIPFIICAIVMKIKDLSGTTANTIWIQSDLRKLFIEPNSLLLADQRR